ncbi:MAG: hypothetical protein D4S02_01875 [Rhodocyclaceae bacterium]|nr:MAG: hypothetical protein D4S02_01875 [Rhodocyclaceae bacterium]
MLLQQGVDAPQFHVVATQRGAAIAGDVAAGVLAGGLIAQALLDRQAHQRLGAGEIDPALAYQVLVVEGDVGMAGGG